MQDLKVVLRINGETGKVKFELNDLEKTLEKTGTSGKKAGEKIGQGMDKGKDKTSLLKNEVGNLKGELVALASIAFATKLTKGMIASADQAKLLRARIDLVTDSAQAYNIANEETFRIAQDTRVALESTVNLYTRLERALSGNAFAQKEILGITETVNKALVVSGATAAETASVVLQLSQGLASGVVRGQEFNAVAEGGSRIMQALKDDLQKTSGELREMAFAGELTTEVITSALKNQSQIIAQEFEKIPATVEGAFVRLGNANVRYFGQVDEAIGITNGLASAITFLAENVDVLYSSIGTVLEVTILFAGAKGIGLLLTSLPTLSVAFSALTGTVLAFGAALKTAILSNPITAGLLALYAGYQLLDSAIESNGEKIQELSVLTGDAAIAMENLSGEISKGFDANDVDVFNKSLADLDKELVSIAQRLRVIKLEKAEALLSGSKDTAVGQGFELASNFISGNGFAFNEEVASKNKTEQINLTKLQAEANKFLTQTFGPLYEAAKAQSDLEKQTASDNKSAVAEYLESATKQLEKIEEQNQAYGKSKSQIQALTLEKIKGLTTDAKLLAQIDKVGKALIKETKQLELKEKATKDLNEAKKIELELLKQSIKLSGEQADLVQTAIDAVETEAERINRVSEERIEALKKEQASLIISADRYDEISEAINRTEQARDDELAQLDKGAIAHAQLLSDLEFEESLIGLSNIERDRAIISRQLEAEGIKASADVLERLVRLKREELGISSSGGFTNDASFDRLIQGGETLGSVLKEAAAGFGQGIESASNSMNVLLQGAQFLSDVWASTAGQDNEGRILDSLSQVASTGALGPVAQAISQVATTINSLTGGGLFGTSYELQGTTRNVNIGQAGASGTDETLETRKRSLFRGTSRRRTQTDLDAQSAAFYDSLFESALIGLQSVGSALGVDVPELISAAFTEEYDKDGNLIKSFSEVFGVIYEETADEFRKRFLAESLISGVDARFEGTSALLNRFRGDADQLLEAAQLVVEAGVDLNEGVGLFDTLGETIEVVESLSNAGESLTETYERVYSSTLLLDDALDIIGISFELARDEYVNLATEIADAAGGVQRATELWQAYFENFYAPEELDDIRLNQSSELLGRQAENLGIDSSISLEGFRDLFNEQLPSLTAEQIAGWLEFAETLVTVNELQDARNQALAEEAEALLLYNDFATSIASQIDQIQGNGPTEFQAQLTAIDDELQDNIVTLNDMAQAAGLAGASQDDLANAHRLAAIQTEQAIGILRDATQSLIDELYGDQAQSQVEDFGNSFTSGIDRVSSAGSNLFREWESALQRIDNYTNSLLTNEQLSPLEAPERLAQARADFYDLVAAANGGDVNAAQAVPQAMEEFLRLLQDVERSGEDYNTEFFAAIAAAQGIDAPTGIGQAVTVSPSQSYIDFNNGLSEQSAEAMAIHRLELSQQLAEHVADLSQAINQPVLELFTEMGGDIEQFLVDLGIDVAEATGESTAMLANLASTLDITVTELGEFIGLSLGSLADAQSLLNDGLEFTIDQLPEGIQSSLEPLLKDVENAADGTAQELALSALESATSDLPAEYRNMLAPYFENIDATTEAQQTVSELRTHTNLLSSISRNLGAANDALGIPSYDVGTPFVPNDQIAQIHKGEMIIPAKEASILRGMGVTVDAQNSQAVVNKLNLVISELQATRTMYRSKMDEQSEISGEIRDNTGKETPPAVQEQPRVINRVCGG